MLIVQSAALLFAVFVAIYLVVLLLVVLNERKLIYFPDKRRIDPAALSFARIEEHLIETPDGARLICWYTPAAPGRPTILYFHGNGGGLIDRTERFARFSNAGIGLFVMSYRGYSGGTGEPTEKNNVADGSLAHAALTALGADPRNIVFYGESLGSGVAVQLAARHPPLGLVLEAPYSSAVDVGEWRFPFLPVRWLMKDRYESVRYISKLHVPVLIIHGERDGIVPIRFGRKLFAAANEPKHFVAFPKAGHSDAYDFGAFQEVVEFFGELQIHPARVLPSPSNDAAQSL